MTTLVIDLSYFVVKVFPPLPLGKQVKYHEVVEYPQVKMTKEKGKVGCGEELSNRKINEISTPGSIYMYCGGRSRVHWRCFEELLIHLYSVNCQRSI